MFQPSLQSALRLLPRQLATVSHRPRTIPRAVSPHPASGAPELVPNWSAPQTLIYISGSLLCGQEGLSLSLSGSEPIANSVFTSGTHSFWVEAPTSAPLRPNSLQYTVPASLVSPRVPPVKLGRDNLTPINTTEKKQQEKKCKDTPEESECNSLKEDILPAINQLGQRLDDHMDDLCSQIQQHSAMLTSVAKTT